MILMIDLDHDNYHKERSITRMRGKRMNFHASKILFLSLFTAILAILVLGISTDSYAKKKTDAEGPGKTATALIDLNSADQKTLESLPGIGKSTGQTASARLRKRVLIVHWSI